MSLVVHPGRDIADRLGSMVKKLQQARKPGREMDEGALKLLEDKGSDLAKYLARYGAEPLGIYSHNDLQFSETAEFLHLILTGRRQRVPLVQGHLGCSIYSSRVIFGAEALEIREPGEQRFGGMFGVKESAARPRPGLWNGILRAKFPLVATQSYGFVSKPDAQAIMGRKQNQMIRGGDKAASQILGLERAQDDLSSNEFTMGEHQFSVLVYGENLAKLNENMSSARSILADSGMAVAREDLALEGAFWSQFPGNFAFRTRPGHITSRNFAALAPQHTYPAGRAVGNHWGEAVALLRTSAQSPYYFNFHEKDLGHTFICGPSGSGKTVVQNFMLAQLEKFGAQQIFVDKDRGAEIFVRACGGTYLTLKNGRPTGFAPFKALEYNEGNKAFLATLLKRLVRRADRPLTVQEEGQITTAIDRLASLSPADRSLSAVRQLLGKGDPEGIGARLEKWTRQGAFGWVLDNDADALTLDAQFVGFDMTDFLDNEEVRDPLMMYLFRRIDQRVDGRRLVIDVDEFWKALKDDSFKDLAQDGLKTYRKRNAIMVFGTQSPADVLKSEIAHTILEQCPTKIFMPNPYGSRKDYVEGFGLTEEEFRLIREELSPESRNFLIKQGHNSVVVELNLDGLDDELAVLSGRAETVEVLDRVRAEHGDDPDIWGPIFQRERRRH